MQVAGTVQRGQRRMADWDRDVKATEMDMRIFQAAIENRCDEIGRQAEAKCRMDPPQLSDYALDLANQIMHPDPLHDAGRT